MTTSVLRIADQRAGRFPDVCVLSGVATENAVRVQAVEWSGRSWILGGEVAGAAAAEPDPEARAPRGDRPHRRGPSFVAACHASPRRPLGRRRRRSGDRAAHRDPVAGRYPRRRMTQSLEKFLRFGEGRRMKRLQQQAAYITTLEPEFQALSDDELRGEDGRVPRAARRTARSSTSCSSRPTPPCARRACASPTSACSTCS